MGDLELQVFADRLKELRTSLELTQAQFVADLGITASALSAYEKNTKNPSIIVAKRIADKYNISVDWLIGLSNNKNINEECTTYSDIIRMLFIVEKYLDISIGVSDIDNELPFISAYIRFDNKKMCTFLQDWKKMKELHDNNSIDDEVYSLWFEKTINKYQIDLARGDGWDDIPQPHQ